LRSTGADIVAAANPGCLLQLAAGARAAGLKVRIAHPLEILDEALGGEDAARQGGEMDTAGDSESASVRPSIRAK
jgi:glycolate oxidase iron-sulfur subunit